jgi:hypothetical protein
MAAPTCQCPILPYPGAARVRHGRAVACRSGRAPPHLLAAWHHLGRDLPSSAPPPCHFKSVEPRRHPSFSSGSPSSLSTLWAPSHPLLTSCPKPAVGAAPAPLGLKPPPPPNPLFSECHPWLVFHHLSVRITSHSSYCCRTTPGHRRPPPAIRHCQTPPFPYRQAAPSLPEPVGEPQCLNGCPAGTPLLDGARAIDLAVRASPVNPHWERHRSCMGCTCWLGLWAGPAMQGLGLKPAQHCAATIFLFFIFFYNFRNLCKFLKYVENIIRLGKIQNKFLWNPCE